jgi:hypothetical protein
MPETFSDNDYTGNQPLQPPRRPLAQPVPGDYLNNPVGGGALAPQEPFSMVPQQSMFAPPTPPEMESPAAPATNTITTDHMAPESPLDHMLGRYNASENAYADLLRKGPEQFKPSIWRKLAGIALGTGAGMAGGRAGYGRYSIQSGNPVEAGNVAREFIYGPQRGRNEDFQRRLTAAKADEDTAYKDYALTRQQNEDSLRAQQVQSEIDYRNRPSVIGGYSVTQGNNPTARSIPIMPEYPGEPTNLPEALAAEKRAGKPQYDIIKGAQGEPIGITDNNNGQRYTGKDIANLDPQARKFYESERSAFQGSLDRKNADEDRRAEIANRRALLMSSLPTNMEKTEYSRAGSVADFADDLTNKIKNISDQLGPGSGRYNDFMTGKVGLDDPQFSAWKTEANLAATRLMQMHTGNRPAEAMFEHFLQMLQSNQSPENLLANINEMHRYADRITTSYENKMQSASDYAGVKNPTRPRKQTSNQNAPATPAPNASGSQKWNAVTGRYE